MKTANGKNRPGLQTRHEPPSLWPLILSTGYILASAHQNPQTDWPVWMLTLATIAIILLRKTPILLLLAAGAALGWFGTDLAA